MYAPGSMVAQAPFFPTAEGIAPFSTREEREPSRRRSLAERVERWIEALLRPGPAMRLRLSNYPY